uniref:serine/threonine-protein phosphatase 4 regulatory subunit 4 isoform X2 n=1 Tax=Solea senegalensis TaxID=28829 RepID=UPI001CD9034D|nr:serine/threonine-protein phosphatase 4 regulatory subunit 4 isoform X2 [Solea senegalensis]
MNGNSVMFGLEELQDLVFIERPIRRSLKTAEEIDQLTVDEDLNDIERAVYLLSAGQEVQRVSVITNLPSLVRHNPAETFRRVVPKVRDVLNGSGSEIHLSAAASFLTILQDDIILIHTHTYCILKTVLMHLNHRDTVVGGAWLETLLSAVSSLPKETIKQEVLNPLLFQPQASLSLHSRLTNCRILGKVASKFDSHTVKMELLPVARSLCQDVEAEVRVCMCAQLESIARATGVDETKTHVLPELTELAADEDGSVRLVAFDSIINLIDMIDADDRLHVVVPLVMAVCEASSQGDDTVLTSLSFQFGKLCSGLAGSLSDEQKFSMLQTFKVLCVAGLQTDRNLTNDVNESKLIRCNCCYNLPAMVLFCESAPFLSELYTTFSTLCCDPEFSVRQSAAANFHQVVKLLRSNVHLFHKELVVLLQDDVLEVLDALMTHLEETLEAVLSREDNNKFSELLSALLAAEHKVGGSLRWRLHEKLLQRYSCLARLLPGEVLHQNFSARIFIILTSNKVLPVQKEAARTFCTFLRYNRKQEQRQEMIHRLIKDLAQGRSYWSRLRFLDVCETATEIFSKKFFNKHFLVPALELVHDPVANVRYKLCQLLPRLRSSLRLPTDRQLLQQLDFCVQKLLCREKDKDVVATIRKTVLELDKLDLTEPCHRRQEKDFLDEKKEKEELLLLEMEQLEHQSGGRNPEKHAERKWKDGKTRLSAVKSTSVSVSSSGAGNEMRKAKLTRSRSLSSQSTSKPTNAERAMKIKEFSSSSGSVLNGTSVLRSKTCETSSHSLFHHLRCFIDDSLRTAHFTLTSQSTSSMPFLICSNTSSLLENRTSSKDHGSSKTDRRTNVLDHRTGLVDHRTSTLDHRTTALDYRTRTLDQRSRTMERGCGVKDSQSRKLSVHRKSKSFCVQSGQE